MATKKNIPAMIGYGPWDSAIIDGFGANKNAEEIARSHPINGTLTPAQCLDRLNKLIASKDVLDVAQRRQLLVDQGYGLLSKLKKQIDELDYVAPDQAMAYLKTIKEVMEMVDRANGQIEEAMLKFNQRRADELMQALVFITDRMFEKMLEKDPNLDIQEAQVIVLEALPQSLPEVSR